jgi:putative hydrolase of the HAD superfamily
MRGGQRRKPCLAAGPSPVQRPSTAPRPPVWLFDLDNTLHDASHAAFGPISEAMTRYIVEHVGIEQTAATALRQQYWKRYGATLLGLVRHHGIKASHFLDQTHRLPGLEARLRSSASDRAALPRLRGRKVVLTNAPKAYAERVLDALGLARHFADVLSIEDMAMFGQLRPKPDRRMLRGVAVRLKIAPSRCILVEDTLEHQKAARSLGMGTVWMQRYLGGRFRKPGRAANPPPSVRGEVGVHRCPKPPYVCAKIRSLQMLLRAR